MRYFPADSTLISLAAHHAATNDLPSITVFLRNLPRRRLPESIFLPILRCYAHLRHPHLALSLFHSLLPRFLTPPTFLSLNSTLSALLSSHQPLLALHLHRSHLHITPNLLTFNLLLASHARGAHPDQTLAFFREFHHLHRRRFSPDVFSYTTVISALVDASRLDEAVSMLDEMSVEGVAPAPATFNVILRGFCRVGDFVAAGKILNSMRLKNCEPNQITYNTVIHGLMKRKKVEAAVNLFGKMSERDCVPNDVTFATILDGFVKNGRMADAEGVLGAMLERNLTVGPFVYSALIGGMFRCGRVDDAMRLWMEMVDRGVKPNTVLYTNLVDGLCRVGRMDAADEVFGRMVAEGDCRPNAFTFSCMVRGYFKAGKPEKALAKWKEMVGLGNEPTTVSYSILINGLCEEGRIREGLMVWRHMMGKGCEIDVVAYTSMIKGLFGCGRAMDAVRLFHEMVASGGVKPDVFTYNVVFTGLCRVGDLPKAVGLLNRMVNEDDCDGGCDPDEVTCNVFLGNIGGGEKGIELLDGLVVRLCARRRVKGIANVVELMLRRGFTPLATTWEKVVRVVCRSGKVMRSLERCWRQIVEVKL